MTINPDKIPHIDAFDNIKEAEEQILWAGIPLFKPYFFSKILVYIVFIGVGMLFMFQYVGLILIGFAVYQILSIARSVNHIVYAYSNKRVMTWKGNNGKDFSSLEFSKIKQVLTHKPDGIANKQYNTGNIFFDDGVSVAEFRHNEKLLIPDKRKGATHNKSKYGWKNLVSVNGVPMSYEETKIRWYAIENYEEVGASVQELIAEAKANIVAEQELPESEINAGFDEKDKSPSIPEKPTIKRLFNILLLPFIIEILVFYFFAEFIYHNTSDFLWFLVTFFASSFYCFKFIVPLVTIYIPQLFKYTEETQARDTPKNTGVIFLLLLGIMGYFMLHFQIQNSVMEYYRNSEIKNGTTASSYVLKKELIRYKPPRDRDTMYNFKYYVFYNANNHSYYYTLTSADTSQRDLLNDTITIIYAKNHPTIFEVKNSPVKYSNIGEANLYE